MDYTDQARKYEADKITLLGLFVVGLISAHFITASRYTGPRKAGSEVVAEIKRKGITSFFEDRDRQAFFFIRDAADRTIGLTTDAFDSSAPDTFSIQSAMLLHIRGRYQRKQLMIFQGDDRFNQFSWESELVSRAGRTATQILREQNGDLTITELGQSTKQTYKPSSDSIPDILLDLVFAQMLDSRYEKIIVDTIDSDGRTIEVVLSQTRTKGPPPVQPRPKYELDVLFLDDWGSTEKVSLDPKRQVLKILLKQRGTYLFERTSAQDLLRQFPEAADYIRLKSTLYEPNQPQY